MSKNGSACWLLLSVERIRQMPVGIDPDCCKEMGEEAWAGSVHKEAFEHGAIVSDIDNSTGEGGIASHSAVYASWITLACVLENRASGQGQREWSRQKEHTTIVTIPRPAAYV